MQFLELKTFFSSELCFLLHENEGNFRVRQYFFIQLGKTFLSHKYFIFNSLCSCAWSRLDVIPLSAVLAQCCGTGTKLFVFIFSEI